MAQFDDSVFDGLDDILAQVNADCDAMGGGALSAVFQPSSQHQLTVATSSVAQREDWTRFSHDDLLAAICDCEGAAAVDALFPCTLAELLQRELPLKPGERDCVTVSIALAAADKLDLLDDLLDACPSGSLSHEHCKCLLAHLLGVSKDNKGSDQLQKRRVLIADKLMATPHSVSFTTTQNHWDSGAQKTLEWHHRCPTALSGAKEHGKALMYVCGIMALAQLAYVDDIALELYVTSATRMMEIVLPSVVEAFEGEALRLLELHHEGVTEAMENDSTGPDQLCRCAFGQLQRVGLFVYVTEPAAGRDSNHRGGRAARWRLLRSGPLSCFDMWASAIRALCRDTVQNTGIHLNGGDFELDPTAIIEVMRRFVQPDSTLFQTLVEEVGPRFVECSTFVDQEQQSNRYGTSGTIIRDHLQRAVDDVMLRKGAQLCWRSSELVQALVTELCGYDSYIAAMVTCYVDGEGEALPPNVVVSDHVMAVFNEDLSKTLSKGLLPSCPKTESCFRDFGNVLRRLSWGGKFSYCYYHSANEAGAVREKEAELVKGQTLKMLQPFVVQHGPPPARLAPTCPNPKCDGQRMARLHTTEVLLQSRGEVLSVEWCWHCGKHITEIGGRKQVFLCFGCAESAVCAVCHFELHHLKRLRDAGVESESDDDDDDEDAEVVFGPVLPPRQHGVNASLKGHRADITRLIPEGGSAILVIADGSKLRAPDAAVEAGSGGRAAAAFSLSVVSRSKNEVVALNSWPLHTAHTAGTAEAVALHAGLRAALRHFDDTGRDSNNNGPRPTRFIFCGDCVSVYEPLAAPIPSAKSLRDPFFSDMRACVDALRERLPVDFVMVPSHVGWGPHDAVDADAGTAAQGPSPVVAVAELPLAARKNHILFHLQSRIEHRRSELIGIINERRGTEIPEDYDPLIWRSGENNRWLFYGKVRHRNRLLTLLHPLSGVSSHKEEGTLCACCGTVRLTVYSDKVRKEKEQQAEKKKLKDDGAAAAAAPEKNTQQQQKHPFELSIKHLFSCSKATPPAKFPDLLFPGRAAAKASGFDGRKTTESIARWLKAVKEARAIIKQ